MISLVAVDKNWGIGKSNKMPWNIPGELVFFKEVTYGGIVVMGRKTLESLPNGKPLKGRRNIVLSKNPDFTVKGVEVVSSPEELLKLIHNENEDKVFLIGGASIYHLLLPYCKKAYITKVEGEFEVDTYHSNLDNYSEWQLCEESSKITSNIGITYTRCVYENIYLKKQP